MIETIRRRAPKQAAVLAVLLGKGLYLPLI